MTLMAILLPNGSGFIHLIIFNLSALAKCNHRIAHSGEDNAEFCRYYEDTVIITSDKKFGLFMQKVYEICSFVVDYMSKYEVIGAFANTAKNFQDKNPDNDDLLDNCYNQIVQQIRIFLERHADRTRLSLNELKKFSDPKIFLESEDEFDFEKEFDDEVEE